MERLKRPIRPRLFKILKDWKRMACFQGYGTLFVFGALSIFNEQDIHQRAKFLLDRSISLVLPSNMFTADLTVCMDISPNPGPARQNSSVIELSHHCLHTPASSVDASITRKYSQSLLKSLRFSSQTKYINNYVYSMFRRFGILKPFRGCRGGKSFRFREYLNDI